MSTISVPIPAHLEESLNNLIKNGRGSNKAELIRRAITAMVDEEAIQNVLQAQQEIREGKYYKVDLRKLLKKV
jgi:Arc/MetJ-type ribon-helix-helix transcriptional regulator